MSTQDRVVPRPRMTAKGTGMVAVGLLRNYRLKVEKKWFLGQTVMSECWFLVGGEDEMFSLMLSWVSHV